MLFSINSDPEYFYGRIAAFSGDKKSFWRYRVLYLDLAARSSTTCEFGHGLLGFVLPDAEWLALDFPPGHVAVPFLARRHPGPAPVLAVGAAALQVSVHNALFASWRYEDEQYHLQQSSLNTFKGLFIDSLDAVSRRLLTHPVTGTRNLSVQAIDTHLYGAHGILSPADLRLNEAALRAPYQPDLPIHDHTSHQQELHAIAQANGSAFSEAQKVEYLIASLRPCNTYNSRIDHWIIAFPTVVLQTFLSLADAVHVYSDNRTPDVTSSIAGYSAAVLPTQPSALVARAKSYCWSHGTCSHSSQDCLRRQVGHVTSATSANRKGGSTFVYPAFR